METEITSAINEGPVLTAKNAPPSGRGIRVTERALKKLRAAMHAEGASGGARLCLEGGGCAGLNYTIGFEAQPGEHDRVYEFDGVRLFVDPKSFIFLYGMILDYDPAAIKPGFTVINPNSKKSCGCGSSFSG